MPHHSFAVFCVYPWTGLLGDDRRAAQALTVLDMCRIRWGRVVHVHGDRVEVAVAPPHLGRAPPRPRRAPARDGRAGGRRAGLGAALEAGDWVAMHWEWVCDRLTDQQVRALSHYTGRHLRIVNDAAQAGPLGLLA